MSLQEISLKETKNVKPEGVLRREGLDLLPVYHGNLALNSTSWESGSI